MEEKIENENGISLGYIFRTIFSQKWLALIIAVAITLAGTFGLYFLGKSNEVYSVTFVSKIPGSESSPQAFDFPDGKEFRYEVIVSYDNLKKVKDQNKLFDGIDIQKMYEKGDISIIRTLKETASGSGEYEATYKIDAKAKYFKESAIARDFLTELTLFPVRYLESMSIDYDKSLEASREAIQYDVRLSYLNDQLTYLNEEYNKLIEKYSENFVVRDGKTLNYYKSQLLTYSDRGDIDRLKIKAIDEHIVMGDENGQPLEAAIAKYKSQKVEKVRERDRIQAALNNAIASVRPESGSIILDADAIMNYTIRIAELDQDIADIQKFIDESRVSAEFEAEVGAVETKLSELTNLYSEVASAVYSSKTIVNYMNTNIIAIENGRGIVMSAAISLVLGLAAAAVVAYIVGWSKQKKVRVKQFVNMPVYGEARLQIAVSDETHGDEENRPIEEQDKKE